MARPYAPDSKPWVIADRIIAQGDTAPAHAPLFIQPSAAPTGTAAEGDIYFDSTAHALYQYNGSAWEEVAASIAGNQTIGGTLAVTGAATFSSTVAAPRVTKTAAATLVAADCGALCLFNAAAGMLYTLPAAAAGLWFDFAVTVTCTSGVHRIACASGDFLLGSIHQSPDGTDAVAMQDANGTSHLAWEGNGSTTGGIKGDRIRVTAISGTQWIVEGINTATGTEATPFKTS